MRILPPWPPVLEICGVASAHCGTPTGHGRPSHVVWRPPREEAAQLRPRCALGLMIQEVLAPLGARAVQLRWALLACVCLYPSILLQRHTLRGMRHPASQPVSERAGRPTTKRGLAACEFTIPKINLALCAATAGCCYLLFCANLFLCFVFLFAFASFSKLDALVARKLDGEIMATPFPSFVLTLDRCTHDGLWARKYQGAEEHNGALFLHPL